MSKNVYDYEILVVGAGHAGCEAAYVCAKMGLEVLLLTLNLDTVAWASCNPAMGGLAKGHLVKEIDALGGLMASVTDKAGIWFKQLNTSKGPAVRSSRAQIDKWLYVETMKGILENSKNIYIKQDEVTEILVKNSRALGVKTALGDKIYAKAVIITPGTFLDGVIHIGKQSFSNGRLQEKAAVALSKNLKRLKLPLGRFKTGTCPRLDKRTIDFSGLVIQKADKNPIPFSFKTPSITQALIPCHTTYTNKETHNIIRKSLSKSALYGGVVKSTGVRYCPSIEDKIVKFADKERHQVFLEPEGRDSCEYYPNGLSNSLPLDVQLKMLHSIEGLEQVKITRPGYAIEHDYVDARCLHHSLETKLIKNLFLAGQIDGTTGYEEAAALGLMAGINAGLKVLGKKPFILDRYEAFIGVLIDDLVTKGTNEPYRMFTSRCEHRLILREDNANLRLSEFGYKLGLVDKDTFKKTKRIKDEIALLTDKAYKFKIKPSPSLNRMLKKKRTSALKEIITLRQLIKRPNVSFKDLKNLKFFSSNTDKQAKQQLEIALKYEGYIERQKKDIEKLKKIQGIKIPVNLDYDKISLSTEIKEKLKEHKPHTLGEAYRISGVTPAAIAILIAYLSKRKKK